MSRQNLTVFHLERLQPDWLPSRARRLQYVLVDRVGFALAGALVFGLVTGLVVARVLATQPLTGIDPTRDGHDMVLVGLSAGLRSSGSSAAGVTRLRCSGRRATDGSGAPFRVGWSSGYSGGYV